jgi:hypothetical protein
MLTIHIVAAGMVAMWIARRFIFDGLVTVSCNCEGHGRPVQAPPPTPTRTRTCTATSEVEWVRYLQALYQPFRRGSSALLEERAREWSAHQGNTSTDSDPCAAYEWPLSPRDSPVYRHCLRNTRVSNVTTRTPVAVVRTARYAVPVAAFASVLWRADASAGWLQQERDAVLTETHRASCLRLTVVEILTENATSALVTNVGTDALPPPSPWPRGSGRAASVQSVYAILVFKGPATAEARADAIQQIVGKVAQRAQAVPRPCDLLSSVGVTAQTQTSRSACSVYYDTGAMGHVWTAHK